MGGLSGGSAASGIAISTVKDYIDQASELTEATLRKGIEKANAKVHAAGNANPAYKGMGTTFVALGFVDQGLLLANIGDSRAYRLRNGQLSRLTEDHTFGTVLEQTGVTSSEKAEENPMSHFLYRSVGPAPTVEADCWVSTDPPQPRDTYLICTDGLYAHLKDYEIAQTLETCPIEVVAKRLVSIANDRGGKDNVTVIAIQVSDSQTDEDAAVQSGKPKPSLRFSAWSASMFLVLGLVVGYSIASYQSAFDQQNPNLISRLAFSGTTSIDLPPAGIAEPRAALGSFDIESIIEQDAEQALPELQMKLFEIRELIEVATRKLSIWHQRREQFFRSSDIKTLAAEVAVTSPSVKEHLDSYNHAQWEYLGEAEKLIYQPADRDQEQQVLALSQKRDKELDKLREETHLVIDHEVSRSLYLIRQLSAERDKIQNGMESISRKIGLAESD
jgi:protein phosphatase